MLCATASLGVLLLWNLDDGLSRIDKYQYSTDNFVKGGSLLAFGLMCSNTRSDCDAAYALIAEQLEDKDATVKLGAILGLGIAYAGTHRQDLLEALTPAVVDTSVSLESSAMAAVSLGLIFVGSCNQEAAEAILSAIMDRQGNDAASLEVPLSLFFGLALGLLFLNSRNRCESTLAALSALAPPLSSYSSMCVEGMAWAGSGDVLKVQKMLQVCVEKREGDEDNPNNLDQAVALINIPLIGGLNEEIGTDMCLRTFDHLLQYADVHMRRAVPLAFALHSPSNPRPTVVDTLSKLTHDPDPHLALHAILALGIVGAGTNNSRIAQLLRQLASFYGRDASALFVIRLSQGLLYMGKGLMSISPIHSDRFLVSPTSLAALLVAVHACLHAKQTILGRQSYLLYHLVGAMHCRWLITVDKNMKPISTSVRVGQAVDTVGLAGVPKSITGFQTLNTPVLLSYGDRAELASEEYIAASPVLEGIVFLSKNPDYTPSALAP
eukprot:GHVT01058744.1.p1 GENE.GHVT01058744.1~~GHVT01058744.1.p1  ORF type:complete len:494 (-),score=108.79 GHVT01058744.1:1160-2641(-)